MPCSMNGSELAGFVHGAEVVEPTHLASVVHSSTLWPPEQAPPQRVKRTVVSLEAGSPLFSVVCLLAKCLAHGAKGVRPRVTCQFVRL
eukprot:51946-Pelagomonas_calceolata.AAC.3